ncbi:MAG: hypothetical protein CMH70_00740 [Nitrosomonadaceae bacterium]|nr:hypothetical protein [Nitrosomonadaceae bacterium]|tara:strand:+ start:20129 stop:21352 length:1224 start_codon:yes stop_codon:yes gene_type:complete
MPQHVIAKSVAENENSQHSKKIRQHKHKQTLAVGATYDKNGTLWLAEVKDQKLLVSYSKNKGESFSIPVIVTPIAENIYADGENRPKIAITQNGIVLLTWSQKQSKKYSGDIRFSRSIDSGQTFSSPITLNDDGLITGHRFDSLTTNGKGKVIIAWLDARDRDAARNRNENFTGISIYTAQSNDNGENFDINKKFHEHVCECCRVPSVWTTDGPIVFWRNIFGKNTRDFAISNLEKGGIRRVTNDEWQVDGCPHHGGDIALGSDNRLHLAWFTLGKNRQGLFYKYIQGAQESTPIPIGDSTAQASHPSIAASGKNVLVTWREFDGKNITANIMYSTDGGATWTNQQRLADTYGPSDYPMPLINNEQQMQIIWNTKIEGLRIIPVGNNLNFQSSILSWYTYLKNGLFE